MSEFPPHNPANDAPSWREVFEGCESGLRAFLGARLSQQVDVEDCLQAVCVKMLESGQNVAPAARRAWLFRVAGNEAAGIWRRKATTERVLEKQASYQREATEDDTSEQAIQSETAAQLRQAVDQLPENWQKVVQLRMRENLTFQQIADQLQIPLEPH